MNTNHKNRDGKFLLLQQTHDFGENVENVVSAPQNPVMINNL